MRILQYCLLFLWLRTKTFHTEKFYCRVYPWLFFLHCIKIKRRLLYFFAIIIATSSSVLVFNFINEHANINTNTAHVDAPISFKSKPNIYLFWLELYHDFDTIKNCITTITQNLKITCDPISLLLKITYTRALILRLPPSRNCIHVQGISSIQKGCLMWSHAFVILSVVAATILFSRC